jgi:hypothetical protein
MMEAPMRHLSFVLLIAAAMSMAAPGTGRAGPEGKGGVNPSALSKALSKTVDLWGTLDDVEKVFVVSLPVLLAASIAQPAISPAVYHQTLDVAAHLGLHVLEKNIEEWTSASEPAQFKGWSGGPSPSFSGPPAASSMPGIKQ